MLRTVSFLTLGLLTLTACPGDDTGTTAGGSAGSTSAATTTENATDTNPMMTTEVATGSGSADTTEGPGSTTDTPGTTTDMPGTTTDTPGTTTDEPGTTTGGMGGACEPDAADDDCAMCVKNLCCTELEACQLDAGCTCFQECAQKNPGIPGAIQCGTDCMVNPLGAGTPTGELAGCTQANCGKCLG